MKRVLAIDPGERVGWAHGEMWSGDEAVADDPNPRLKVTGHGINTLKDFAVKYDQVVGTYDVVIYETWRLNAGKVREFAGSEFPSVQLIGMVRLGAWRNPHVTLVSQAPGVQGPNGTARKTVAVHPSGAEVAEILARMPKSHDDSHDGSALLHLWHYFWSKYL